MRRGAARGAAALVAALALAPSAPLADEDAGALFYLEGRRADGAPVQAKVGQGQAPLPATLTPCVNCHGDDGLGRAERGVTPPAVRWAMLTAPQGRRRADGSVAPPYDLAGLARTVREGVAPDGRRLSSVMPRYAADDATIAALAAFLDRLGEARDPGVTDAAVRIGALAVDNAVGAALTDALRATAERVNGRGGVHGRRLEIVVRTASAEPTALAAAFAALLDEDRVFAVVAPMAGAAMAEVADAAERAEAPVIAPFATAPPARPAHGEPVFFLDGGLDGQARALAAYARGVAPATPAAVFSGCGGAMEALAARLVEEGLAEAEREGAAGPALVLGDGACAAAATARAAAAGADPILLPAYALSAEVLGLPREALARVRVATASLPGRAPTGATEAFGALALDPALRSHVAAQRHGFNAVSLLSEAMSRTGRRLSRAGLRATLESGQPLSAGFAPLQSFSANGRIGSRGFFVTPLVGGAAEATWIEAPL